MDSETPFYLKRPRWKYASPNWFPRDPDAHKFARWRETGMWLPLYWPWQRAYDLVRNRLSPSPEYDGPEVQRVSYFLLCLEHGQSPEDVDPELHAAYAFHEKRDDLTTYELQARLLAGETSAAIREKTGIPADVAQSFHDVFCHVQPYFGRKSLLSSQTTLPPDDPPLLLKVGRLLRRIGFIGGPLVLDPVLKVVKQTDDPAFSDGVPDWSEVEGTVERAASALLSRELGPLDYDTLTERWRLHLSLVAPEFPEDPKPCTKGTTEKTQKGARRRKKRPGKSWKMPSDPSEVLAWLEKATDSVYGPMVHLMKESMKAWLLGDQLSSSTA